MPDYSITIRRAENADIESLIMLLAQLFEKEQDFLFNAGTHRRGLTSLLARSDAWVWVAVTDERVIGMCTGQRLISTAAGGPSLHIEDVVIDTTYRGQGIGKALFRHIETWAENNSFVRLQLNADADNIPALAFYKRLGMERSNLTWLHKHINEINI